MSRENVSRADTPTPCSSMSSASSRALQNGQWLVLGSYTADECASSEPFEAVELELALVFPPEASAPEP